jgi:hypothetical protein
MVLLFKSGAAAGVPRVPRLFRSRNHLDGVSEADLTFSEHPRVDSAPSRMKLLRDSDEFSVDERAFDCFAGVGERGDLEQDLVAKPELRTGNSQTPIDPFQSHVFSDCPDIDGMTFGLERTDSLNRKNANRFFGPAVVLLVVLCVSYEP